MKALVPVGSQWRIRVGCRARAVWCLLEMDWRHTEQKSIVVTCCHHHQQASHEEEMPCEHNAYRTSQESDGESLETGMVSEYVSTFLFEPSV